MEARNPRPDRSRAADPGSAGRQPSAVRDGVAPRPSAHTGPRHATVFPVSGRVAARPTVRTLPIFTHAETGQPRRYASLPAVRAGFGLPNLRRNVCPHFYMTGSRGAIPIQAPHLLKALIRQDQNVSRCQLRGGVHLEQGYVNDVCLTPRFNQCVFYEDELTKD
ncbi:MAG: hypothetical protein ABSA21_12885 [Candidatus Limnocylindrales bacterium]